MKLKMWHSPGIALLVWGAAMCAEPPPSTSTTTSSSSNEDACPTQPDIDNTPAPDPGPAAPAPTADCGTPSFPAGTTLRRYPYLQSVTATSARIVWTATVAQSTISR